MRSIQSRADLWARFAAAALARSTEPWSAAMDADAMLSEFENRFRRYTTDSVDLWVMKEPDTK